MLHLKYLMSKGKYHGLRVPGAFLPWQKKRGMNLNLLQWIPWTRETPTTLPRQQNETCRACHAARRGTVENACHAAPRSAHLLLRICLFSPEIIKIGNRFSRSRPEAVIRSRPSGSRPVGVLLSKMRATQSSKFKIQGLTVSSVHAQLLVAQVAEELDISVAPHVFAEVSRYTLKHDYSWFDQRSSLCE